MTPPPHSIEAEIAVIGAMMVEPRVIPDVCDLLRPEAFHGFRNRTLFRAMIDLNDEGKAVDPVSLGEYLKKSGRLDDAGGLDYVAEIMDVVHSAKDVRHHAMIVREKALLRVLMGHFSKMGDKAEKHTGDPMDLLTYAERQVKKIRDAYTGPLDVSETNDDLIDEVERRLTATGIRWPWESLNGEVGLMIPGELVLISGYSGNGKTQFAANLTNKLHMQESPVIVFATEMGAQWVVRLAAIRAGVSQFKAEKNAWDETDANDMAEREKLHKALKDIRTWDNVYVELTSSISPEDVQKRSQEIRRVRFPGQHVIVIVDHVHRLAYRGGEVDKLVGLAAQGFKNMAKDDPDGMTVVALAQPRKPEGTGNLYAPVRGHQLRGSQILYNEADLHFSVFRMYVEVDMYGRTKTRGGFPMFRFPKKSEDFKKNMPEGVALCSDYTFINVDKRRVGGEGGVLYLPFESYTGRIP